jgi:hypothetical protein
VSSAISACGVRPAPLFVPVEQATELEQLVTPAWIAPASKRGGFLPATPLYQLRKSEPFPMQIEVGFGGIDAVLDRLAALPHAPAREEIVRRIRCNHPGIDVRSLRVGTVLDLRAATLRAPTRKELIASPIVRRAIEQAWIDSQPHDPVERHEEGGWIYLNVRTGEVFTHRAPLGNCAEIDLSRPVLYVDSVIVGTFHTHPHPPEEKYELGPSRTDEEMDGSRGVPGIIRSHAGYHAYGCERRASLRGRTGFFPGTPDRPLD